jgi:predicted CXXCH cytochrome family protein
MMRRLHARSRLVAMFLVAIAGLSAVSLALAAESGRVPVPTPPKGRGEKCVADTNFMRRYHMVMLAHQRDKTVIDGIRTKRFSLKECVDCHAVTGSNGQPVSYQDPKHFCRSCHEYAAVKIDCFECHASKPETRTATGLAQPNQDMAALLHYLRDMPQ